MPEKQLFIILAACIGLMSLILFVVMGIDKSAAKGKRRRVPEKTLFLLAALGGGLGGVLGMSVFRHKTKHISFRLGMPALLLLNLAAAYAIMTFLGS